MALKRQGPEPTSFDTPERAELAQAIAAAVEVEAEISKLAEALARADRPVLNAREALEAAEVAVADAPAAVVRHAVAAARGDEAGAPVSLAQARAARQAAADELDEALAVRSALRTSHEEAVQRRSFRQHLLRNAAVAVLRAGPSAAALAGEVDRLQRELYCKGAELTWLVAHEAVPMVQETTFRRPADPALYAAAQRMFTPPSSWNGFAEGAGTPSAQWEATIDALMRDANAALPSTEGTA